MFVTPSFKKSLIVEQFQGHYLKCGLARSSSCGSLTAYKLQYSNPTKYSKKTNEIKNKCKLLSTVYKIYYFFDFLKAS